MGKLKHVWRRTRNDDPAHRILLTSYRFDPARLRDPTDPALIGMMEDELLHRLLARSTDLAAKTALTREITRRDALRAARPANWISAAALLVAIAAAAFTLLNGKMRHDIANDRRCLVIQSDMLSARPRRADGPDLFQALGCRPKGDGSVYAPAPQRRHVARESPVASR